MQHAIKNVLYCTDLSQNSNTAFGYAIFMAKLTGADIHLLHVLEKLSDDAAFTIQTYVQSSELRHEMLELRVENARKLLDKRQEAFWSAQSDEDAKLRDRIKSITVCEAYPADEILKSAKEHNCDLIIMGSHERGLAHTFLGSVSKAVLRRAPVPTMIVPLHDAS